jgi:RNA polymerase sigma-70 factor (ECF subfamily)
VDQAVIVEASGSTLADDERAIIVQQVAAIPEDLREVVLLRYYEDLTYDEMARWLGVARATVNERLAKARALLRIRLARLRSDV